MSLSRIAAGLAMLGLIGIIAIEAIRQDSAIAKYWTNKLAEAASKRRRTGT